MMGLIKGKQKEHGRRRPAGSSLTQIMAQALGVVVAAFGICALGLVLLGGERPEQRERVALPSTLAGDALARALRFHSHLLEGFIEEGDLGGLIAAGDARALRERERMLERMLPLALKVRFIPAAESWEGDGATPELGFASLELIRRVAEGAEAPPAEVHQFGNAHRHIALARPIPGADGGAPVGVAHLALSQRLIDELIGRASPLYAEVELQQVVEGAALALAGGGGGGGGAQASLPVDGSIWRLVYWMRDEHPGGWLRLAVVGGSAVLALVGLVLLFLRLRGLILADRDALEGLAGSELAAPGLRPARARLKELDPLYPLLSRRRPQAGASPQAAPDAVGLEIERVRQEPPPRPATPEDPLLPQCPGGK
ncbi:MAG: hypothetical protein G8D28_02975 [gamma proteobacterium symbiont of Phacoides pectinatus]